MYRKFTASLAPITFGFLLLTLASGRGQNWAPTSAPPIQWTSIEASADGSKLVAVANVGGIYVSTNSAAKWKLTSAPRSAWTAVGSSADGSMLVATANTGIYLSSNGGDTWKSANVPNNSWFSVASSTDGQTLAAVADHGGIYVSTDSGSTWNQSDAPVEPWSAVAASEDGSIMIAVADPGAIYTSTNSGLNWNSNSAPIRSWSAVAASADGSELFAAATLGGIFISTNFGLAWTATSATNDSWTSIACSADGTNLLAGALHSGLYVSSDAGQTWTKTQALGMGWLSVAMSADATSLYAAAFNDGIFAPGSASGSGSSTPNGTYQGLFYDTTNGVAVESSGFANISVKSTGAFSTRLQFAGQSFSCSGKFSASGASSNSISRKGLSPLTLVMQLNSETNGLITGQVSADAWTAQLVAYAGVFSKTNPCPQVGQYTLAFPGSDDPATGPVGDGYAAVKVDSLGNVSIAGKLSDGTPISSKISLSQNPQFPLFASLYSGQGLFLGWLTFSNQTDSDLSGPLTWIAPSNAKLKIDPAGFTNQLQAAGSGFQFIPGTPVLNITNGLVSFDFGDLAQNFTNQILLTNNSTVVNLSSNKLTCKITTSSGLFSGSVSIPGIKQAIPFAGVILQKDNIGTGYFLGGNQNGRVSFGP